MGDPTYQLKLNNMNIEWRKISEETLFQNEWIKLRQTKYRLPSGIETPNYYIVEKPDVVVGIISNQNKEVYLIKEWERGIEEVGYKFPAGRLEKKESPEEAIKRELNEELGITALIGISFLGLTHVEPGLMPTKAYYYLCKIKPQTVIDKHREPTEVFVGDWMPWHDLLGLIESNKIKNPFVLNGVLLAGKYFVK
jgi:mutator protein MutT